MFSLDVAPKVIVAAVIKSKSVLIDVMANTIVWFGVIASWQESLEYWLRTFATIGAILVSIVTIFYMIKNKEKTSHPNMSTPCQCVPAAVYQQSSTCPVTSTATGSTAARTFADRFADHYHVKDWGVVGDGETDDTEALQNAADGVADAGGGTLSISGCSILISSSVELPDSVCLVGDVLFPDPRDPQILTDVKSSILLSGSGTTITLNETSGLGGLKVLRAGMSFPAAADVAGWTGTAVTIAAGAHAAYIGHSSIVGFARAVDMGTSIFTEQTRMEYVAIDCQAGVKLVSGTDRVSLVGVECWPTASMGLPAPVVADYRRSGIAFELAAGTYGIDAPTLQSCFSYGYVTGFKLNSVNGASLVDCVTDYTTGAKTTTIRGFHITGDTSVTQMTNCKSYRANYGVYFAPNNTNHALLVNNCSIEYADDAGIYCTSGYGSIINSLVRNDTVYTTYGIQVDNAGSSSRFFVNGCLFDFTVNAYAMTGTTPGDVIVPGKNIVTGNGTNIFLGGGCNTYASASTVDIPADADTFFVSGAVAIDNFNTSFAYAGRKITPIFLSNPVVNNSAGLKLAGSANFNASANDNLTLVWSGSYWSEVSRTVI